MSTDANDTDFLVELRNEKRQSVEARTSFILKKVSYATALLGLGSLEIDVELASRTGLNKLGFGFLLYLAPFVALACDLYILAEDYSVKRFGAFLERSSPSTLEREWEAWVSKHRDPFGPLAMPLLTSLILAGAALILWVGGTSQDAVFYMWVGLTLVFSWGLYFVYKSVRAGARQGDMESPAET